MKKILLFLMLLTGALGGAFGQNHIYRTDYQVTIDNIKGQGEVFLKIGSKDYTFKSELPLITLTSGYSGHVFNSDISVIEGRYNGGFRSSVNNSLHYCGDNAGNTEFYQTLIFDNQSAVNYIDQSFSCFF